MKTDAFLAIDNAMYSNMYDAIDTVVSPAVEGSLSNAVYQAAGDTINRYWVNSIESVLSDAVYNDLATLPCEVLETVRSLL